MSSKEDIELAGKLAHEIGNQARGTKDSERSAIASMAILIERLLSNEATDAEREEAEGSLHPSSKRDYGSQMSAAYGKGPDARHGPKGPAMGHPD